MGSPLITAAQKLALREWERSTLGQLMAQLSGRRAAGNAAPRELRELYNDLRQVAGQHPARRLFSEVLGENTAREVERYAAGGGWGGFLNALGPLGSLIRSMASPKKLFGAVDLDRELEAAATVIKAFGGGVLPPNATIAEQRAIAERLKSLGWQVDEPGKPGTPAGAPPKKPPKSRRVTEDVDFGNARPKLIRKDDEVFTGEMIEVESSNVHSIGFRVDDPEQMRTRTGTLLIRFLATHPGGPRVGPGPMYEYRNVPVEVFLRFRKAASAGKFVWDNIRVRGTVSGHQYAYDLADIQGSYVPRQAGLKRGQSGEWFLTRTFTGIKSKLPPQMAGMTGPPISQSRGSTGMNLIPNRGTPKRDSRG